ELSAATSGARGQHRVMTVIPGQRNTGAPTALACLIQQSLPALCQLRKVQNLRCRGDLRWRLLGLRARTSTAEERHPKGQHSTHSADDSLSLHDLSPPENSQ